MKIALVCGFSLYVALKRFKSCNSENSVQNVIIAGKKRAYTIVAGKFRENKTVSLKKPVYNVLLH